MYLIFLLCGWSYILPILCFLTDVFQHHFNVLLLLAALNVCLWSLAHFLGPYEGCEVGRYHLWSGLNDSGAGDQPLIHWPVDSLAIPWCYAFGSFCSRCLESGKICCLKFIFSAGWLFLAYPRRSSWEGSLNFHRLSESDPAGHH